MRKIFAFIIVLIGCSHSAKTSAPRSIELSHIDKGIFYDDFSSLLKSKFDLYPLTYFDYVDSTYLRGVITKDKMDKQNFTLTYYGMAIDYADLYFFNNRLIGFKIAKNDSSDELENLFLATKYTQEVTLSKTNNIVAKEIIEQKKYKELDSDQFVMSFYKDPAKSKDEKDQNWVIYLDKVQLQNMIRGILEDEFRYLSLFRSDEILKIKENPEGIYESDKNFYDSILIKKK